MLNLKKRSLLNKNGFTLIELVAVVSIVGLLSGITMRIINADSKRKLTEDAVKQSNMRTLADSLEAHRTSEGKYPNNTTDPNPFIKNWPAGVNYTPVGSPPIMDFYMYIQSSADPAKYFKYSSSWGEIKKCTITAGLGTCL